MVYYVRITLIKEVDVVLLIQVMLKESILDLIIECAFVGTNTQSLVEWIV